MKKHSCIPLITKSIIALLCVVFMTTAMSGSSDRDYAIERLGTLYDLIEMYYYKDVDPEELYRSAAKGMLDAVEDKYTRYVVKDTLDDTSTSDTTEGNFGGVGTIIQKVGEQNENYTSAEENWVLIADVLPGSPAEKAGLQRGDFITAIDGVDTLEFSLKDTMDAMRGEIDSTVVFDILRARVPMQIKVTRGLITVPTVKYAYFSQVKVGYIAISSFTPYTPRDTKRALESLRGSGATSIVLDLRGNPGGAFQAAQETADLFINKGYIVHSRGKNPFFKEDIRASHNVAIPMDMPLYVLIDANSASASEVLSGALQDHGRATILGRNSFGKGVVQAVLPFYGDQVLITSAEYLTPKENHIHGIGVKPEVELPLSLLSKDEIKIVEELLKTNEIYRHVAQNYPLSEEDLDSYVLKLKAKYPGLSRDLLERQVRIHMNKFQDADIFANPLWDDDIKHTLDYIIYGVKPIINSDKNEKTPSSEEPKGNETH